MDERKLDGRASESPRPTPDREFEELDTDYDELDDDSDDEDSEASGHDIRRRSFKGTSIDGDSGRSASNPFDLPAYVPFSRLYEPPIPMVEASECFYIPGLAVNVSCGELELDSNAPPMMQSNQYAFELHHGDFRWTVKKRHKHFIELHATLKVYRATMAVPLPSRTHQRRRRSFIEGAVKRRPLPRIPKTPDSMLSTEQAAKRHIQLADYLRGLLSVPAYRNHPKMIEFLEISPYSFLQSTGRKGREAIVSKRAGGHRPNSCFLHLHMLWFGCISRWRKRWLIAKDSYVVTLHPATGAIRAVLLMDRNFKLEAGLLSGLQMTNSQRSLCVDLGTKRNKNEWMEYINQIKETTAKDFVGVNSFNGYAPPRKQTYARWYVDGAMYMKAVANALENAEIEILITGWWLTPEIFLKRPPEDSHYWRLDEILKRKAESGVHIFIMLYKEVPAALNIDSIYSKRKITGLHKNIRVLRHPDHMKEGVLLWAHHEKLVIVDQKYAFYGGIDLCYGRWDDALHRLTDTAPTTVRIPGLRDEGHENSAAPDNKIATIQPPTMGTVADSIIERVAPIPDRHRNGHNADTDDDVGSFEATPNNEEPPSYEEQIDSFTSATGDHHLASSASPKAIELLNLASRPTEGTTSSEPPVYFDQELCKVVNPEASGHHISSGRMKLLSAKRRLQALMTFQHVRRDLHRGSSDEDINNCSHINTQFVPDEGDVTAFVTEGARFWLGKDYANFIFKDITNMDQPFAEQIDRNRTPRMPWHDIGALTIGRTARDLARHFIQRWNFIKNNKAKRNDFYPWLLPMSYEKAEEFDVTKCEEWFGKLYRCEVQALRSASSWSVGIREYEHSIEEAYVDLIKNAKHFIYIENQFFISLKSNRGCPVNNRIADALVARILKAHADKRRFRVYVVLPLLPAFEGEVGTSTGASIQAITHWNYTSLCRGPNSILERLKPTIENPYDYIAFFGLRKHGVLNGIPVTELIYVHSKLMIVDDCQAIIGSANINDRSMLGNRDSEVAAVSRDQNFYTATFDGQPVKVGMYASSLRRWLFREHLGGGSIKVDDPVSDQFYNNTWKRIARENTRIFDHVFHPIPTNGVTTFAELKSYQSEPSLVKKDPAAAAEELQKVIGHLVELPEEFLQRQCLMPSPGTKEHILPVALWT